MLCASHVTVLEAAMLSRQCKDSCDLNLQHFSSAPPLDVFALFQSIMNYSLQLLHKVSVEGAGITSDYSKMPPSYPKACGCTRPRAVTATSLISPSQRMRGTTRANRSRAVRPDLSEARRYTHATLPHGMPTPLAQ